jgi:phosphinothricin acetyltransferase
MESQPSATSATSARIVRPAQDTDLPAVADIYNDVVLNSTATFDLEPRTPEQQRQWLGDHSHPYAALVAVDDSEVVGFATLSPFRPKPAYRFTAEESVYVRADYQRKGIGVLLLTRLLDLAAMNGFHSVIARITDDNPASLRLHRRLGFRRVGVELEVGYKLDRWVDVVIMQRILAE